MGKRVLVGMSGGVDSSVAAALLCEAGYEVIGVTLNVWPERDAMQALVEREDACCALGAVEDARRVADHLGIPYYVLNFKEVFEEGVAEGVNNKNPLRDMIKTERVPFRGREIGTVANRWCRCAQPPANRWHPSGMQFDERPKGFADPTFWL